jgi:carbon monoxide dehydrogenase subunit G
MAVTITESFEIGASARRVWDFLLDPHEVVRCMPGAALDEVVDDRTFLGTIRVKVGPITASYKGRVRFVEVDLDAYRVEMSAEGREATGSGNARATMTSRLTALTAGRTSVTAEARAEITGRVMQFGQSMIEGVSHQLFLEFVKRARERLESESPRAAATPGIEEPAVSTTTTAPEAVSIVPVVLGAAWRALVRFLRRVVPGQRASSRD